MPGEYASVAAFPWPVSFYFLAVRELAIMVALAECSQQVELARRWNDRHPGSEQVPVLVDLGDGQVCRARSHGAAMLVNGVACITVRNIAGLIPLSKVTERYSVWVRVNRKGQTPHWTHTVWDSEEECKSALAKVAETDDRVICIETSNVGPSSV